MAWAGSVICPHLSEKGLLTGEEGRRKYMRVKKEEDMKINKKPTRQGRQVKKTCNERAGQAGVVGGIRWAGTGGWGITCLYLLPSILVSIIWLRHTCCFHSR